MPLTWAMHAAVCGTLVCVARGGGQDAHSTIPSCGASVSRIAALHTTVQGRTNP